MSPEYPTYQAMYNGLGDCLLQLCPHMRNVCRNMHADLSEMSVRWRSVLQIVAELQKADSIQDTWYQP